VPLSRYLVENDITGLIAGSGKGVVVHVVITGGPAMLEAAKALAAVLRQFPESAEIVVWLNEVFRPGSPKADKASSRRRSTRKTGGD
jgi:hypothetical protein